MNWEEMLSALIKKLTAFGGKLLIAILILVIGSIIVKKVKKFLKESKRLSKLDMGIRSFLVSFCSIALYTLLFITVAMTLGIPATSFITILASCGVAIGLAMQGALSNFAGGIMILLFKPFKIGDYIETANESGTVSEISVVYTVLLTPDNKKITIPNGSITNSIIENYSSEKLRRVDLTFNTDFSADIETVKSTILNAVSSHPLALKNPEPFVGLSKHADSSLEYAVRIWCKTEDYWTVYFDINEKVKDAFDKNKIKIPFPQLDVHIDK